MLARSERPGRPRLVARQSRRGQRPGPGPGRRSRIGKTHLIDALQARSVGHGALVLRGGADEIEHDRPGRILLARTDRLEVPIGALLGNLDASEGTRGFTVVEAVVDAVENAAADRPVVVVAEDLHWADALSLRGIDRTEELVAIADEYRASTESWADVLRDLNRRGLRAPVLAVGDGRSGSGGRTARTGRRRVISGRSPIHRSLLFLRRGHLIAERTREDPMVQRTSTGIAYDDRSGVNRLCCSCRAGADRGRCSSPSPRG